MKGQGIDGLQDRIDSRRETENKRWERERNRGMDSDGLPKSYRHINSAKRTPMTAKSNHIISRQIESDYITSQQSEQYSTVQHCTALH
jgi:hypothetical protein